MHPEFPLERICTHRCEPVQLTFARNAMQRLPQHDDSCVEASHQGLVLRGETESALERDIELLREYYGNQIQITPAKVRYHKLPQLEEPHMGVRVRCASQHFQAMKAHLLARGAISLDEEVDAHFGTLRLTAPLANLLGFERWLRELAGSGAHAVMWLSHYAPAAYRTHAGTPPEPLAHHVVERG